MRLWTPKLAGSTLLAATLGSGVPVAQGKLERMPGADARNLQLLTESGRSRAGGASDSALAVGALLRVMAPQHAAGSGRASILPSDVRQRSTREPGPGDRGPGSGRSDPRAGRGSGEVAAVTRRPEIRARGEALPDRLVAGDIHPIELAGAPGLTADGTHAHRVHAAGRRSAALVVARADVARQHPAAGSGLQVPTHEGTPYDGLIVPRTLPRRFGADSALPALGSEEEPDRPAFRQLAQFQLPGGKPGAKGAPPPIPAVLPFQYAYGSDSELVYRRDADLDKRVRDNSNVFAPTFFGLFTWRPRNWLEGTIELTLERQLRIKEERTVVLPSGEIVEADKKRWSLLIDQAFVRFRDITDPFEIAIGRRNFEDPRLFLYDAALDGVSIKHRWGDLHTEVTAARENLVDLDLFLPVRRGRINDYILYVDYRGIEDHRLATYAISRHDSTRQEGQPLLTGVRAFGRPSDRFNYWAELGFVRGKDQRFRRLAGYAYDVGFTYRFPDLPLAPSFTLSYAYGSGDGNPDDNRNTAYRQTGLQSNETRFSGVTQFKKYGEALDPELSNLQISTIGIGFRPAAGIFVDLVYHRYRLNKIAEGELRGSPITALMNQIDTEQSKDVGSEIDIILGFRNLFGFRRFGFEVRAGIFRPGRAYRTEDGGEIRKPDKSISFLGVFIW